MNEPIKKQIPQTSPESYKPEAPKMMNMLDEQSQDVIDNIIKNHIVEMIDIEYIHLPALKFIGMETKSKGKKAGEMWLKSKEFMPILDSMTNHASSITAPCGFMHQNDMESGKKGTTYHYIVGKFMTADAPVPDGFVFREIPESDVAIATFYGEFSDMIKKMYVMTRDKILHDGKGIPYPIGYFYAEIYINECDPTPGKLSKLSYLFSCKKIR